ncbi:snRNA-activating protein complex subunit 4-like [Branchiostoma lanceolatum]|uniref:snRNA-activating protein complex subunit 4-like n=1 Tax=Branchiostoma lanceolatum TaxID=7740 RepID=UPI0034513E44
MAEQSIDLEREKIERETEQIKQVLSGRLVIDSSEGEYSSEEESDHEEKLTIASPVEPFRSSVSPRISNAASRPSSQVSRDTLILTPHTVEGVHSRPSSGLVIAGPSSAPDVGYQQEEEDQTEEEVQGLIQDLEPEEVLELNQNYQDYIHDMLNRVQLMLAQNRERQAALKSELTVSDPGSDGKGRRSYGLWSFYKPYFKDSYGNGPPPNEDSRHKRDEKSVNPFVSLAKKWAAKDNKILYAAVRSDGMQKKTRSLMNKLEIYTTKLRQGAEGADRKELQKKVQDIREEINKITEEADTELLGDRLDPHDWDKIANVDFDGAYTPSACQLHWQSVAHPSINQKNWTEQETSRLEAIAAKHGAEDWVTIAQELGTGRTAIQCLRKYQTDINSELRKRKWSPEEDQLLTELVEKLRLGDYIPYQQIAYFMEGRTITQCCHRWAKTLDPNVVKGKWSVDEDIALLTAVAKFGAKDWWKISRLVSGRTDAQVRERYVNVLDPEIKRGPFTYYEDKQVLALYEKYGPAWSTIANEIPGRTDCMVLRRFELLLKQRNMTYLPLVRKPNAPVERHSDRTMAKYLGMSMPELLKRREKRLAMEEAQDKEQMSKKQQEDKKPNREKLQRLIELYKQKKKDELEAPEPEQKPDRKTQKIHLLLTTTKKGKGGLPRRDPRLDIIEPAILELLKPPPEKVVKLASGRPRRHKSNRDVLVKKLAASAPPSKPIFTHLLKALHIDIPGALGMIKERQKQHATLTGKEKIKDQLKARHPKKIPIVQHVLLPVPTVTVAAGNQPGQAVPRPATLLPPQQVRTAATPGPAALGIQVLQAPILQQKPLTVAQLTAVGKTGVQQQASALVGAQAVQKVNETASSSIIPPASPSAVPASKAGPSAVPTASPSAATTAGPSATVSAVPNTATTSTASPSTTATSTASPSATATSTAGPSVIVSAVPSTTTAVPTGDVSAIPTAGSSVVPEDGAVSNTAKPQAALPQVVNVMVTGKPDKPGENVPNVGQFLIVLPAGVKMIRPPTLMPAAQLQSAQLGGAAQQGIRAALPIASYSTANTVEETGTPANTSQGTGTPANTTEETSASAITSQGTGASTNTTQETGASVNTTPTTDTSVNTTPTTGTRVMKASSSETQSLQDRPEGLVSLAQVAAKVAAEKEAKQISAGKKDLTTPKTPISNPSTPKRKTPKRKTPASTKTPSRSPKSTPAAAKTPQTVPKVVPLQPAKSATKQIAPKVPIVTRAAPTAPVVPVTIARPPQYPISAKVVRAPSRKVTKVKLLAPNSATLNGFKSLLLGRKKLVAEFEKLVSVRQARTAGLVFGPKTQGAAPATPSRSSDGIAGFNDSSSETSSRPGRSERPIRLPSSVVNPHKDSYCYQMLKNRFEALFLWPALLSTATVDVNQLPVGRKRFKPANKNFARRKRQKGAGQKAKETGKNVQTETDGKTNTAQPAASTSGTTEVKKRRRGQKTELHGEGDEAPQRRSTRLAARPPVRFKRKYTKRKVMEATCEDGEENEEEGHEDQEPLQNGSGMIEEENVESSDQQVNNEASIPVAMETEIPACNSTTESQAENVLMETEGPACNSMAESQAENVETAVNGGNLPQKDSLALKTLLVSSPEKGLRSVNVQGLKEAGHGDLSQSDNDASPYEKYDRYETGKKSSGSDELGSPLQGGTPRKRPLEDTSSASTPPGVGKKKYKKRRTIRDMLSSGSGKE